jgi:FKBP-type peptidyl-prolyl cis-trans isomerase 2
MKEGDFVEIDFIGRIAATGEIFDLTSEEKAREEGIYNPKQKYGPALVVMGGHMVMPALEKELLSMSPGEVKEFSLPPDSAFGRRNPELVKVLPVSSFTRDKINPYPGMFLNVGNMQARVQSVSGGRVRVDFNNPLAGKEVTYWLRVGRQITDTAEKSRALVRHYGLPAEPRLEGEKLVLSSENPLPETVRKMVEKGILGMIKEIKSIEFSSKGIEGREAGAAGQAAPDAAATKA